MPSTNRLHPSDAAFPGLYDDCAPDGISDQAAAAKYWSPTLGAAHNHMMQRSGCIDFSSQALCAPSRNPDQVFASLPRSGSTSSIVKNTRNLGSFSGSSSLGYLRRRSL